MVLGRHGTHKKNNKQYSMENINHLESQERKRVRELKT